MITAPFSHTNPENMKPNFMTEAFLAYEPNVLEVGTPLTISVSGRIKGRPLKSRTLVAGAVR
jgi:hypothetical protein